MGPVIARFVAAAVVRTRTARSYVDQIDQHIAGTVVLSTIAPKLGWKLAEMSTPEVAHLRDLCQRTWQSIPPRSDHEASHLRTIVRRSRQIEHTLSTYAWSVALTEEPAFLIGGAPVLAWTAARAAGTASYRRGQPSSFPSRRKPYSSGSRTSSSVRPLPPESRRP